MYSQIRRLVRFIANPQVTQFVTRGRFVFELAITPAVLAMLLTLWCIPRATLHNSTRSRKQRQTSSLYTLPPHPRCSHHTCSSNLLINFLNYCKYTRRPRAIYVKRIVNLILSDIWYAIMIMMMIKTTQCTRMFWFFRIITLWSSSHIKWDAAHLGAEHTTRMRIKHK